jgi:hypothetical protein
MKFHPAQDNKKTHPAQIKQGQAKLRCTPGNHGGNKSKARMNTKVPAKFLNKSFKQEEH